ncbi:MAG: pitrilysin family protein [Acidobacteriota bacterium]
MSSKNCNLFAFSLAFLFIVSLCLPASAQSGRQRPRNEPPRSNTPPAKQPISKVPESDNKNKNTSNPTPGRVMVPSGAAIIKEEHAGVTSRYLFKNGITLIVREDHSSPIAAATVYVKVGTANEPEAQVGVARVVGRLLAESRASRGGEDPLRQARTQGAVLKNQTDYEATTFSLLGSANKFIKLLELQFKNIQQRSFTVEEVLRAAKLVAQDDRLKLDDPLSYSHQRVQQAAFAAAGSEALSPVEERLVSKEQAQAFYDRYYRANNIIVSVVGDVLADQVRLATQQFLGAMTAGETPTVTAGSALEGSSHVRYLSEKGDLNQTVVSVGYRVPGVKEKEAGVFEVLRTLLTKGRGALLPQALIEPSFASRVAADYIVTNKGGLFVFQMQVNADRLVKAEEALLEKIETIRRVIPSPGELQRAKSLLEKQYYDRTMSLTELAGQLAFWEARGGYKNFDTYLQRINTVNGEQIQQLAAQYFIFNRSVVHEYEPRNAPPRIAGGDPNYTPERFEAFINVLVPRTHKEIVEKDEIVAAPETIVAKQGRERREQETEGGFILELQPQPVRDFSTLRGPRAFVREDQSRPLLAVGVYFLGGRLLENQANSGITELMLRTMLRGTQRQNGTEMAMVLEQLGGELKIVNEPDFFGYTLEVLSRNSEQAMKMLIDIIESPAFDKGEFAREKASLVAATRALRDDGRHRPEQLLHSALYGIHPYGLPQFGLDNSIEKLTENDISEWYQRSVKRHLPLVVIVGDTEGSALVGRFLADGFPRRDIDKTLTVPVVAAKNAASDQVEQRERRQTTQVIGFSGPEGKSPDTYAFEVFHQIVAGPGGRLLTNLQQQELSFDVAVKTQMRQQRSSLLIYISSVPDQEQRARTLVEEEFRRLAAAPFADDEIEAGRNCAAAAALDELHKHGNRAIAYARQVFFGLSAADIDNLTEKFQTVTKEDMRRVVQAYFQPERRAVGVLRASPPPAVQGATAPAQK